MFICKFCQKEYSKNAGGMVHQNQCKMNPNRVSYQIGRAAWNKGKTAKTDERIAAAGIKISALSIGKKPGNSACPHSFTRREEGKIKHQISLTTNYKLRLFCRTQLVVLL